MNIVNSVIKKIAIKSTICVFLLFYNPSLLFQDEKPLVIKGVRVLKIDGLFWGGCQVVIEKGKIKEVGPEATVPEGASIIEGQDKWLMPGLIDIFVCPTTLAKEKPEKPDYFCPQDKIIDLLNPEKYSLQSPQVWEIIKIHKEKFRDALKSGITTLLAVPDKTKVVSGLAGIIKLKRSFPDDSIILDSFALKIGLERKKVVGLQSHMGIVWGIREMFLKERYPGPVLFGTNTEEEIALALSILDEFKLQAIFFGKMDCPSSFSEIAIRKIPLILCSPTLAEVEGFTKRLKAMLNLGLEPALYSEGNILNPLKVLISLKPWLQEEKIQEKELYDLITVNFARTFGLEKRLGSIEKGKDADFVLLDGDPLKPMTKVEKVFIEGELVYEAEGGK